MIRDIKSKIIFIGGIEMKIFHTEKGKEAVYVQMQDIIYLLNETEMPIPASIFTKEYTSVPVVDDSNRFNFVKFDDENEVKFFRNLDFIIDYDQYKDLTDEQFEDEWRKVSSKTNDITEKWNSMNEEEKRENSSLFNELCNIRYKLKFMSEIHAIKHGRRSMPFPKFVKGTRKRFLKWKKM